MQSTADMSRPSQATLDPDGEGEWPVCSTGTSALVRCACACWLAGRPTTAALCHSPGSPVGSPMWMVEQICPAWSMIWCSAGDSYMSSEFWHDLHVSRGMVRAWAATASFPRAVNQDRSSLKRQQQ